jgi:hypothetical protein
MQADGRAVMATMMAAHNSAWMVNFAQVGKESGDAGQGRVVRQRYANLPVGQITSLLFASG